MPIAYQDLLQHRRTGQRHAYDEDRVILYALGVGLGSDPRDEAQLRFVREDILQVMPSFATVAAWDVPFILELGMDWPKLIHAAQSMELHAPFPPAAELIADSRIVAAYDKPASNATLLITETTVRDATNDQTLAGLRSTTLARDYRVDGAPAGGPPAAKRRPDRDADEAIAIGTSPQVALIYRLLGGRASIHSTPAAAREQGFDGPIMHGLSTWGHACHGVLRAACDYQTDRLLSFAARFSAPVYPGETLEIRFWYDGPDVFFEVWVSARRQLVLSDGHARRTTL